MDTWWTRPSDELIERLPHGAAAAGLLFGAEALTATGQPNRPAGITSPIDLSGGVDLRLEPILIFQKPYEVRSICANSAFCGSPSTTSPCGI